MKKIIQFLIAISFLGNSVFAMEEQPLENWKNKGYVVVPEDRGNLPQDLQKILDLVQSVRDSAYLRYFRRT